MVEINLNSKIKQAKMGPAGLSLDKLIEQAQAGAAGFSDDRLKDYSIGNRRDNYISLIVKQDNKAYVFLIKYNS